ncbi:hypothetical protein DCAR_0103196 [Daucus carota subsp. sativus]|uniref:Uncharacterized protein n=1 Tax=Daucus carota subsp. sativus TaxID=79200 RepID=A0A166HTI6_DAUCS|nr:hypothetical protein DCAR_0103196 [Daucus carota subsp. sativus]
MISESHGAFLCSGNDPDDLVARDVMRFYPKAGSLKDANFYICFGRLIALALIHEIQIGIALDRCLFVQYREGDLRLKDTQSAMLVPVEGGRRRAAPVAPCADISRIGRYIMYNYVSDTQADAFLID